MAAITAQMIKELRQATGAGILDTKKALERHDGDFEQAATYLREKGMAAAAKRGERETKEGLVGSYIHHGSRVGVLVEINCETDFAAGTDQFGELAHELAMQVAAQSPQFISEEELPEGADVEPEEACLLLQPYIKDPTRNINDVIVETVARVGGSAGY